MTMKVLSFLLLLLAPLTAVAGATAVPPVAQPSAEVLLKMERESRCGLILVTAMVGGQPMRMLLDTGASHTVLHRESAAKLTNVHWIDTSQMNYRGNSAQRPDMLVASLSVGPGGSPMHLMAVMDLSAVRHMLAEKVDGIVGMDFLGALPFTYDFRRNEYYWGIPEGATLVPLRTEPAGGGRVNVLLRCRGKDFKLLLDTGSAVTRVHATDWPPGVGGEIVAQVGNIDSATQQKLVEGKPDDIEIAPDVVLRGIAPLLDSKGEPAILGLDALKDSVLIHVPSDTVEGGLFFMCP